MSKMSNNKLTLQQKIDELEKINNYFSNEEDIVLEDAIEKYEEASKLVKSVRSELKNIETKIKEISQSYKDDEEDAGLEE